MKRERGLRTAEIRFFRAAAYTSLTAQVRLESGDGYVVRLQDPGRKLIYVDAAAVRRGRR